jgi:hypothetical protein
MTASPTIHASAVLIGAKAVLIRGPSGAGKSKLALALIEAARNGALPFARLVTDDRALVDAVHGRLIVRPPAELAGLLEVRGLGIRKLPYEPMAVIGLVADLAAEDASRMPAHEAGTATIAGICLPRLAVARGIDAAVPLLAWVTTGLWRDPAAN